MDICWQYFCMAKYWRKYFLDSLQLLFFGLLVFEWLYIWTVTLPTAINQTVALPTAIFQVLYLQRLYVFDLYICMAIPFSKPIPTLCCFFSTENESSLSTRFIFLVWWQWWWSWGHPYCITPSTHSISSSPCSTMRWFCTWASVHSSGQRKWTLEVVHWLFLRKSNLQATFLPA